MATNETAETQAAGSSSQQATTLSPTSLLSQLRSPTQSELTRKRVLTNRPTPAREKRSQLAQFKKSIIGTFIEHNRYIFGAVQHSILGRFWSIIGSGLLLAFLTAAAFRRYSSKLGCRAKAGAERTGNNLL